MIAGRHAAREEVWRELRKVAFPDSRFHYNFAEFIADFKGSDAAAGRVAALAEFQQARLVFITPDNNLTIMRQKALEMGLTTIMTTYGIGRGFLKITREDVPTGQEEFAATLDGMERFAKPISLEEISLLGKFNLLITGAAVVTTEGIRFGKGHGFFDLEWAMFWDIGIVDRQTPVVAVVHDCQVIDLPLRPDTHDTIVDYIITPSRTLPITSAYPKPVGVDWERLPEELRLSIPPLQQLYSQRGLAKSQG